MKRIYSYVAAGGLKIRFTTDPVKGVDDENHPSNTEARVAYVPVHCIDIGYSIYPSCHSTAPKSDFEAAVDATDQEQAADVYDDAVTELTIQWLIGNL